MLHRSAAWLPFLFAAALALTRVPGVLPPNFSAVYAFVFCAGAFLPGRMGWALPLGTILVTDLVLNCYYHFDLGYDVFTRPAVLYLAANYAGYLALVLLGRRFRNASFAGLLGGGLLGALAFYLITNTLSWLINPFGNPEYTKTLAGWITALSRGTTGWPQTWEFFRNTLLSSALFTALFAGAWKFSASESPAEKELPQPAQAEDDAHAPEGEEAKS